MLAMNMIGGGGLEIWPFKTRKPHAPKITIQLGDIEIHTMKVRCHDVFKASESLKHLTNIMVGEISISAQEVPSLFFNDPWDNTVQLVQDTNCFDTCKSICGGLFGAIIRVSDMDRLIFTLKF